MCKQEKKLLQRALTYWVWYTLCLVTYLKFLSPNTRLISFAPILFKNFYSLGNTFKSVIWVCVCVCEKMQLQNTAVLFSFFFLFLTPFLSFCFPSFLVFHSFLVSIQSSCSNIFFEFFLLWNIFSLLKKINYHYLVIIF